MIETKSKKSPGGVTDKVDLAETANVVEEARNGLVVLKEILESGDELETSINQKSPDKSKSECEPVKATFKTSKKDFHQNLAEDDGLSTLKRDESIERLERTSQIFERHVERQYPQRFSDLHGSSEVSADQRSEKPLEDFDTSSHEIGTALKVQQHEDILSIEFEKKVEALTESGSGSSEASLFHAEGLSNYPREVKVLGQEDLIQFLAENLPSTATSEKDLKNVACEEKCLATKIYRENVDPIDEAIRGINSDEELTRFLAEDIDQQEGLRQNLPIASAVLEEPVVKLQRTHSVQAGFGRTQEAQSSGRLTRSISSVSDRSKSVRFYESVTVIDDRSISPLHALDKAPTLQASLEDISDRSSVESVESDDSVRSISFSPPLSESEQSDILDEDVCDQTTRPVTLHDRILAYQAATDELHREVERFRVLTSPQTPITHGHSSQQPEGRSSKSLPSPRHVLFEETEDAASKSLEMPEDKEPSPVVVEESHSVSELLKSWENIQTPSSSPAKAKSFQHSPRKFTKSTFDNESSIDDIKSSENPTVCKNKISNDSIEVALSSNVGADTARLHRQVTSEKAVGVKSEQIAESSENVVKAENISSMSGSETKQQVKDVEKITLTTSGEDVVDDQNASDTDNIVFSSDQDIEQFQDCHEVEFPTLPADRDVSIKLSKTESVEKEFKEEKSVSHPEEASELREFERLEQALYLKSSRVNANDSEDGKERQSADKTDHDQLIRGGFAQDASVEISGTNNVKPSEEKNLEKFVPKFDSQTTETKAGLYLIPGVVISKCSEERLDLLALEDERDSTVCAVTKFTNSSAEVTENNDEKDQSSLNDEPLKGSSSLSKFPSGGLFPDEKLSLLEQKVQKDDFDASSPTSSPSDEGFESLAVSCAEKEEYDNAKGILASRPRMLSDISEHTEASCPEVETLKNRLLDFSPLNDSLFQNEFLLSAVPEDVDIETNSRIEITATNFEQPDNAKDLSADSFKHISVKGSAYTAAGNTSASSDKSESKFEGGNVESVTDEMDETLIPEKELTSTDIIQTCVENLDRSQFEELGLRALNTASECSHTSRKISSFSAVFLTPSDPASDEEFVILDDEASNSISKQLHVSTADFTEAEDTFQKDTTQKANVQAITDIANQSKGYIQDYKATLSSESAILLPRETTPLDELNSENTEKKDGLPRSTDFLSPHDSRSEEVDESKLLSSEESYAQEIARFSLSNAEITEFSTDNAKSKTTASLSTCGASLSQASDLNEISFLEVENVVAFKSVSAPESLACADIESKKRISEQKQPTSEKMDIELDLEEGIDSGDQNQTLDLKIGQPNRIKETISEAANSSDYLPIDFDSSDNSEITFDGAHTPSDTTEFLKDASTPQLNTLKLEMKTANQHDEQSSPSTYAEMKADDSRNEINFLHQDATGQSTRLFITADESITERACPANTTDGSVLAEPTDSADLTEGLDKKVTTAVTSDLEATTEDSNVMLSFEQQSGASGCIVNSEILQIPTETSDVEPSTSQTGILGLNEHHFEAGLTENFEKHLTTEPSFFEAPAREVLAVLSHEHSSKAACLTEGSDQKELTSHSPDMQMPTTQIEILISQAHDLKSNAAAGDLDRKQLTFEPSLIETTTRNMVDKFLHEHSVEAVDSSEDLDEKDIGAETANIEVPATEANLTLLPKCQSEIACENRGGIFDSTAKLSYVETTTKDGSEIRAYEHSSKAVGSRLPGQLLRFETPAGVEYITSSHERHSMVGGDEDFDEKEVSAESLQLETVDKEAAVVLSHEYHTDAAGLIENSDKKVLAAELSYSEAKSEKLDIKFSNKSHVENVNSAKDSDAKEFAVETTDMTISTKSVDDLDKTVLTTTPSDELGVVFLSGGVGEKQLTDKMLYEETPTVELLHKPNSQEADHVGGSDNKTLISEAAGLQTSDKKAGLVLSHEQSSENASLIETVEKKIIITESHVEVLTKEMGAMITQEHRSEGLLGDTDKKVIYAESSCMDMPTKNLEAVLWHENHYDNASKLEDLDKKEMDFEVNRHLDKKKSSAKISDMETLTTDVIVVRSFEHSSKAVGLIDDLDKKGLPEDLCFIETPVEEMDVTPSHQHHLMFGVNEDSDKKELAAEASQLETVDKEVDVVSHEYHIEAASLVDDSDKKDLFVESSCTETRNKELNVVFLTTDLDRKQLTAEEFYVETPISNALSHKSLSQDVDLIKDSDNKTLFAEAIGDEGFVLLHEQSSENSSSIKVVENKVLTPESHVETPTKEMNAMLSQDYRSEGADFLKDLNKEEFGSESSDMEVQTKIMVAMHSPEHQCESASDFKELGKTEKDDDAADLKMLATETNITILREHQSEISYANKSFDVEESTAEISVMETRNRDVSTTHSYDHSSELVCLTDDSYDKRLTGESLPIETPTESSDVTSSHECLYMFGANEDSDKEEVAAEASHLETEDKEVAFVFSNKYHSDAAGLIEISGRKDFTAKLPYIETPTEKLNAKFSNEIHSENVGVEKNSDAKEFAVETSDRATFSNLVDDFDKMTSTAKPSDVKTPSEELDVAFSTRDTDKEQLTDVDLYVEAPTTEVILRKHISQDVDLSGDSDIKTLITEATCLQISEREAEPSNESLLNLVSSVEFVENEILPTELHTEIPTEEIDLILSQEHRSEVSGLLENLNKEKFHAELSMELQSEKVCAVLSHQCEAASDFGKSNKIGLTAKTQDVKTPTLAKDTLLVDEQRFENAASREVSAKLPVTKTPTKESNVLSQEFRFEAATLIEGSAETKASAEPSLMKTEIKEDFMFTHESHIKGAVLIKDIDNKKVNSDSSQRESLAKQVNVFSRDNDGDAACLIENSDLKKLIPEQSHRETPANEADLVSIVGDLETKKLALEQLDTETPIKETDVEFSCKTNDFAETSSKPMLNVSSSVGNFVRDLAVKAHQDLVDDASAVHIMSDSGDVLVSDLVEEAHKDSWDGSSTRDNVDVQTKSQKDRTESSSKSSVDSTQATELLGEEKNTSEVTLHLNQFQNLSSKEAQMQQVKSEGYAVCADRIEPTNPDMSKCDPDQLLSEKKDDISSEVNLLEIASEMVIVSDSTSNLKNDQSSYNKPMTTFGGGGTDFDVFANDAGSVEKTEINFSILKTDGDLAEVREMIYERGADRILPGSGRGKHQSQPILEEFESFVEKCNVDAARRSADVEFPATMQLIFDTQIQENVSSLIAEEAVVTDDESEKAHKCEIQKSDKGLVIRDCGFEETVKSLVFSSDTSEFGSEADICDKLERIVHTSEKDSASNFDASRKGSTSSEDLITDARKNILDEQIACLERTTLSFDSVCYDADKHCLDYSTSSCSASPVSDLNDSVLDTSAISHTKLYPSIAEDISGREQDFENTKSTIKEVQLLLQSHEIVEDVLEDVLARAPEIGLSFSSGGKISDSSIGTVEQTIRKLDEPKFLDQTKKRVSSGVLREDADEETSGTGGTTEEVGIRSAEQSHCDSLQYRATSGKHEDTHSFKCDYVDIEPTDSQFEKEQPDEYECDSFTLVEKNDNRSRSTSTLSVHGSSSTLARDLSQQIQIQSNTNESKIMELATLEQHYLTDMNAVFQQNSLAEELAHALQTESAFETDCTNECFSSVEKDSATILSAFPHEEVLTKVIRTPKVISVSGISTQKDDKRKSVDTGENCGSNAYECHENDELNSVLKDDRNKDQECTLVVTEKVWEEAVIKTSSSRSRGLRHISEEQSSIEKSDASISDELFVRDNKTVEFEESLICSGLPHSTEISAQARSENILDETESVVDILPYQGDEVAYQRIDESFHITAAEELDKTNSCFNPEDAVKTSVIHMSDSTECNAAVFDLEHSDSNKESISKSSSYASDYEHQQNLFLQSSQVVTSQSTEPLVSSEMLLATNENKTETAKMLTFLENNVSTALTLKSSEKDVTHSVSDIAFTDLAQSRSSDVDNVQSKESTVEVIFSDDKNSILLKKASSKSCRSSSLSEPSFFFQPAVADSFSFSDSEIINKNTCFAGNAFSRNIFDSFSQNLQRPASPTPPCGKSMVSNPISSHPDSPNHQEQSSSPGSQPPSYHEVLTTEDADPPVYHHETDIIEDLGCQEVLQNRQNYVPISSPDNREDSRIVSCAIKNICFDSVSSSVIIEQQDSLIAERSLTTPKTADSMGGAVSAGEEFSFRIYPGSKEAQISVGSGATMFQFSSDEVFASEEFSSSKFSAKSPSEFHFEGVSDAQHPILEGSEAKMQVSVYTFDNTVAIDSEKFKDSHGIVHTQLDDANKRQAHITASDQIKSFSDTHSAFADSDRDKTESNASENILASIETVISKCVIDEKQPQTDTTAFASHTLPDTSKGYFICQEQINEELDPNETAIFTEYHKAVSFSHCHELSESEVEVSSLEAKSEPLHNRTFNAVAFSRRSVDDRHPEIRKTTFTYSNRNEPLLESKLSSDEDLHFDHRGASTRRKAGTRSSRIPIAKADLLKKSSLSASCKEIHKPRAVEFRLSQSLPTRSPRQKLSRENLKALEVRSHVRDVKRTATSSKLPLRRSSIPRVKKKHRKLRRNEMENLTSPGSTSTFSRSSSSSNISAKFRKSGGSSPVLDSTFRNEPFTNKVMNSKKYIALREGVYTYKTSPALEKEGYERPRGSSFSSPGSSSQKIPQSLVSNISRNTNFNGNKLSRENPFLAKSPRLDLVLDKSSGCKTTSHSDQDLSHRAANQLSPELVEVSGNVFARMSGLSSSFDDISFFPRASFPLDDICYGESSKARTHQDAGYMEKPEKDSLNAELSGPEEYFIDKSGVKEQSFQKMHFPYPDSLDIQQEILTTVQSHSPDSLDVGIIQQGNEIPTVHSLTDSLNVQPIDPGKFSYSCSVSDDSLNKKQLGKHSTRKFDHPETRKDSLEEEFDPDVSSALSSDSVEYSCSSVIREIEAEAARASITPDSFDTLSPVFPSAPTIAGDEDPESVPIDAGLHTSEGRFSSSKTEEGNECTRGATAGPINQTFCFQNVSTATLQQATGSPNLPSNRCQETAQLQERFMSYRPSPLSSYALEKPSVRTTTPLHEMAQSSSSVLPSSY